MHNSFISIVTVVENNEQIELLPVYLNGLYEVLPKNFTDYEIILVNNSVIREYPNIARTIPSDLKQNIYLLNLSSPVNRNHAMVAGLDRANGDYTVIFDLVFHKRPEIIEALYQQAVLGNDITYLKAKKRRSRRRFRLAYTIFYWILKNYSDLQIDDRAHDTRIISRRALNSLLRLRENLRYMKAIYSIVGYNTTCIEVEEPIEEDNTRFSEKFRTSLVAITSFYYFFKIAFILDFPYLNLVHDPCDRKCNQGQSLQR